MKVHASVAAAAILAGATAAHAGQMFATNNLAATPDGSDTLIVFDPAQPDGYTTIGSLGVSNVGFGGLDFDAQGNLWAYASFNKVTGGASSGLYKIDMATGVATPQGQQSPRSLQDLAYNPVDGQMYGINTQGAAVSTLYTVDLATGAVTTVGALSGLPTQHHLMGFAIDSNGTMFFQDLLSDAIYSGSGLSMSLLYDLEQDTNYSQGMTIDWSRDDQGYHGAVGQGEFPNYFSQINLFETDGSGYTLGPNFGPNSPEGAPPVEPGDLAIMPVPAPSGVMLLGLAAPVALRRRRR